VNTLRAEAEHPRPWVNHYPPGIAWDAAIDTTPVHQQFFAAAARAGDKPALDFLGKTTSYASLARSVTAMAGALQQKLGVKKGSRVALLLPNTPFYVIAYYAVLSIGGTVVNCNPLYSTSELSHITGNAGADILITLDLKQVFDKAEALVMAGHVKTLVVAHFPEALPMVKSILYRVARAKDLADLPASRVSGNIIGWSGLLALNAKPTPVVIDAACDVAVQQYTGGTTGSPKGAMLSHANIASNMSQIDKWGLDLFYEPSKVVAVLPFFHIFAMTVCMNVPLCNGIEVVMLPRFELKAFLELLARKRPNILPAVPTLLHAIATKTSDPSALSSLTVAVSGGAPLSNETRAAFQKVSPCLLAEGYGLTEASPVVCCAALQVPSKPLSIGQPLPGTDVRFVDIDSGNVVGVNQRGELQVKGPQVMLGYFGNESADHDAFIDGWLRTGDVGYVDEDGYVFLVDRIKDLIISSGFNVYPRTIEEALMTHKAVDEVNVIGVPDEYRGEAPVAFVKLVEGQQASAEELRKYLVDRVSKLEMPKDIIFKDQLPKTLIGKLSKKELREEYQQRKAGKADGDSVEQA
jgi:long-chain acyl-CoA synthetase